MYRRRLGQKRRVSSWINIQNTVGSKFGERSSCYRKATWKHRIEIIFSTKSTSIFAKNGSYGYGDKSRWGPSRVHLGANGAHWIRKLGQNRKKLPCPKIQIFHYPAVGDPFFSKKWKLRLWCQIKVGPPRVHLGTNGVPLGPKNGSKPQKITMPRNSNCRLPQSSIFRKKRKFRLWRQITVGTP